jgi:hypothetical protein
MSEPTLPERALRTTETVQRASRESGAAAASLTFAACIASLRSARNRRIGGDSRAFSDSTRSAEGGGSRQHPPHRNAMTSLYEVLKIVGLPIAVLLLIGAASLFARRKH